jgi:hypothetical protein
MSFIQGYTFKPFAAIAVAVMFAFAGATRASSETAGQISTRDIVLGALAGAAAVVLYEDYHHTQGAIVGRTQDGGTVYIDGRIVFPGGTVVYLSNDGRHPCDYYGDEDRCGLHARAFVWRYVGQTEWHGEGLHRGWEQGHGNPHHDDDGGSGN